MIQVNVSDGNPQPLPSRALYRVPQVQRSEPVGSAAGKSSSQRLFAPARSQLQSRFDSIHPSARLLHQA